MLSVLLNGEVKKQPERTLFFKITAPSSSSTPRMLPWHVPWTKAFQIHERRVYSRVSEGARGAHTDQHGAPIRASPLPLTADTLPFHPHDAEQVGGRKENEERTRVGEAMRNPPLPVIQPTALTDWTLLYEKVKHQLHTG